MGFEHAMVALKRISGLFASAGKHTCSSNSLEQVLGWFKNLQGNDVILALSNVLICLKSPGARQRS